MKQYDHYSFDLWGTLIKRNPKFNEVRNNFILEYIERKGLKNVEASLNDVENAFSTVGRIANNLSLVTGRSFIDCRSLYRLVLYEIIEDMDSVNNLDVTIICKRIESIFLLYPPLIYSSDTIPTLQKLFVEGKSLSILSNTTFIKGEVMNSFLTDIGILNFFRFTMYSDEENLSKPNPIIFERMYNSVGIIDKERIVHVGNDSRRDSASSIIGIPHLIINTSKLTIKDLLDES